jgi:hypothetical protein
MFWEFFFILQIGIKIASAVPCFTPAKKKKKKKPTRPVNFFFWKGAFKKKQTKRQLMVRRCQAKTNGELACLILLLLSHGFVEMPPRRNLYWVYQGNVDISQTR